jgi:hypothetical protein
MDMRTAAGAAFEIRSEAHGPHWIAWVTRGADPKPVQSVVLVGETREEAEARARQFADQLARQQGA